MGFDIEKMKGRRKEFEKLLEKRFGSENPDVSALCSRCHIRYGDHYVPGAELFCPDEWVAAGHSLSII